MITSPAFAGKHFAVLGLARSGRATVDALLASGARVTAWDDSEAARNALNSSPAFAGEGDHPQDGGGAGANPSTIASPGNGPPPLGRRGEDLTITDFTTADLSVFDSIVVTPGLPLNRHPIAQRARAAGVEIIGDIELFARARKNLLPHKVVGITGTNGKSTTTALVHHILHEAGVPTLMGGNIGLPILTQDPLPAGGVYVLELSSYQLDLTKTLDCDVAVLLNITPDHLDRYESFETYSRSKRRLFEMQSERGWGVFNQEDEEVWQVVDAWDMQEWDYRGQYWPVLRSDAADWEGQINVWGHEIRLEPNQWPALQGPHNFSNAAAAIGVCQVLEISPTDIEQGLRTFAGLPHRMERVLDKDGVLFVNDSKATNATATAPALAAFPAIRWILGGQAKSDNLDECAPHFSHVRKAYTIGEASETFAKLLSPHMAVAQCGTLEAAVKAAAGEAEPGDTVLLSPACASFDQFTDFEARGNAFRAAVEAL